MAKRKRLTPVDPARLAEPTPAKKHRKVPLAPVNPPIADVARDAAREAAMTEVTEELTNARKEGRLVQMLDLDAIVADHLVRDRLRAEDDEMRALKASIATRGQQTPIDVVTLSPGRYGLISGWRRLAALRALRDETDDADRFGQIKALNRTPETSSDAYLTMVEENEIRVGLSYYERARIAMKAAEQGVYPTPKKAVLELFRSASRPKRSKIHSFLALVEGLDGYLKFPEAIPERLGLRLAKNLEEDTENLSFLQGALDNRAAETPKDEIETLEGHLRALEKAARIVGAKSGKTSGGGSSARKLDAGAGIVLSYSPQKVVITGALVSEDFAEVLARFLRDRPR